MTDQAAAGIARQAAELLPEPPPAHDAFGYLAWEELVLATASRLQRLLGIHRRGGRAPSPTTRDELLTLTLNPSSARLDGTALLTLAELLTHDEDTEACEVLLSRAVVTSRDDRRAGPSDRQGHRRPPHAARVHRRRGADVGLSPRL